jgi:hypothetical protein
VSAVHLCLHPRPEPADTVTDTICLERGYDPVGFRVALSVLARRLRLPAGHRYTLEVVDLDDHHVRVTLGHEPPKRRLRAA